MSRRSGNVSGTSGAGASSRGTGLLPFATTTCEPSEPMRPASTYSAAAFPARTCLSLGRALASLVSAAVCGPSSRASLATYDRASSSWRTYRPSSAAESERFSETFPKRGTMLSGSIFGLPTLELPTAENASSSSRGGAMWSTPTVEDAGRSGSQEWALKWAAGELIPSPQQRLRTQVLWPRPDGSQPEGSIDPDWVGRLMGFPDDWTSSPTGGLPSEARPNRKTSPRAPPRNRHAVPRRGGNGRGA